MLRPRARECRGRREKYLIPWAWARAWALVVKKKLGGLVQLRVGLSRRGSKQSDFDGNLERPVLV